MNENVSLVISRQLLTDVGSNLTKLPDDVSKVVSHFTLDKVQPRVVSFEEQVCSIFSSLLRGGGDALNSSSIFFIQMI